MIGFLVGNERWSKVTETRGSTLDGARTHRLDTVNWSRLSREMTASWTSTRLDTRASAHLYSYAHVNHVILYQLLLSIFCG